MPIRDSIARAFGLKASVLSLADGSLPDQPLDKAWDDASLISTYLDDPWPYLCVNKLAENAALAPLKFGIEDDEGEFEWVGPDHPVQSLWDSPNEQDDGPGLLQLMLMYLELVGHAPVLVERPMMGSGAISAANRNGFELCVVNPSQWRIVVGGDGSILGYVLLNTTGPDVKWTPDQMTYLRWPNPANRWYGQGRLAAVRAELLAEEYASLRDKNLEKNLGVPPGILTSEMPLGEPTAAELQRRWQSAVGGYRNAGKIAVLGSKTTYQAITASAREAEWDAVRQRRQDTISMAFGIPPVLMRMTDATFANAEQARAELWEGALQPRLNRIAAMITRRIVPMLTTEPLVARFDFREISALNENEQEAVTIVQGMSNTGVVTVGELRARLNLEPFGDERDDEVVMPSTLSWSSDRAASQAAAEALAAQPQPMMQPNNEPGGPDAGEQGASEGEDEAADGQRTGVQSAAPVPTAMKRRRRSRDTLLAPVRSGFGTDLAAYFKAQRGALRGIKMHMPTADPYKGAAATMNTSRYGRDLADNRPDNPPETKALPEDLIQQAQAIIMAIRWRTRLERISRAPIETSHDLGAQEAALDIGIPASYLVGANEGALASVLQRTVNLPNLVNSTTLADVENAIRTALDSGEGTAGINARLNDLFDGYEQWRVDRIARTETAYAYAGGAAGQLRDAGVSQVLISDGDDDDECAAADGATWTIDQYEAEPLGHPNCTRDYTAIFDSEEKAAEPPASVDPSIVALVEIAKAAIAQGRTASVDVDREVVIVRDPVTNRVIGTREKSLREVVHAEASAPPAPTAPPVINVTIAEGAVQVGQPDIIVNLPEQKARNAKVVRDESGAIVGMVDG